MKKFEIITLFEEIFPANLGVSIFKKSFNKSWTMKTHDLKKYGIGEKRKIIDDEVFGGSAGMLIRCDVIENAMEAIQFKGRKIFLTPRGKKINQQIVEEIANSNEDVLILCARYEGIDHRAIEYYEFEEYSIGDFVLAGAEVAALCFMEAVIRKLDGVVGNSESVVNETFENDEIAAPKYTRPAVWNTKSGISIKVDDVLISGNHQKIKQHDENLRKKIKTSEFYSAGGIIFTMLDNEIKFLILHQNVKNGVQICSPKGKIENNETNFEAAKREIFEETGLKDLKFIDYIGQESYYFHENEDYNGKKTVNWYLFFANEQEIQNLKLEKKEGFFQAEWLNYYEAFEKISHESFKKIFKKANELTLKDLGFQKK